MKVASKSYTGKINSTNCVCVCEASQVCRMKGKVMKQCLSVCLSGTQYLIQTLQDEQYVFWQYAVDCSINVCSVFTVRDSKMHARACKFGDGDELFSDSIIVSLSLIHISRQRNKI